jgi:cholesterol transport system auxiliary component
MQKESEKTMKTLLPARLLMLVLPALLLLGGCAAGEKRDEQTLYDLGPLPAQSAAPSGKRVPVLAVAEISAPAWMDSSRMVYRLHYDNPLEARTYAQARWTMAPSRLLLQRVKTGLAQSGTAVLSTGDGAVELPQLRIDVDDFSQIFESGASNHARVMLRASVLQDRRLLAQQSFSANAKAPSADAAGGVRALADASDLVIRDMIVWLNALPLAR